MYSSVLISKLAREDFERARRRAIFRHIVAFILRRPNRLVSLNAMLETNELVNQRSLGVRTVPVNQIVGTLSRTHGFDKIFMPDDPFTEQRWISVMKASYRGIALPPISLLKVGERYYVVDGHHRISVARAVGQTYMDAEVTEIELRPKLPAEA
ncbi:MAG: ParB N-terminal domain-containing protein [Anaerolineae bacterium]|nr:ParB N-terminal domain-containing protein [Anaerolineae bacterium]